MTPKTIANLGGVKVNGKPSEDPETDVADDEWNRQIEDTAQCTQTVTRAWVRWLTISGGSLPIAVPISTIVHDTNWGSGASSRPVITKTATGRYTVTFPTTQTDGLGVDETVSFRHAMAGTIALDAVDEVDAKVLTRNGNIITIKTIDESVTPPVLSDVGANSSAPFEVELLLR